jgi:hypothetical protein
LSTRTMRASASGPWRPIDIYLCMAEAHVNRSARLEAQRSRIGLFLGYFLSSLSAAEFMQ